MTNATQTQSRGEPRPDDLQAARRHFFDRLQERFSQVRGNEVPAEVTEAENRVLSEHLRRRIEARQRQKREVAARLDEEIARDEALIRRLDEQILEDRERLKKGEAAAAGKGEAGGTEGGAGEAGGKSEPGGKGKAGGGRGGAKRGAAKGKAGAAKKAGGGPGGDLAVTEVPGVGAVFASRLEARGVATVGELGGLSKERLAVVLDSSEGRAEEILRRAGEVLRRRRRR